MYARTAPEWELVGGDPTPGDPCSYERLSGFFGETADNAEQVNCWLRGLARGVDDTIWRGDAANAFREDIDELPKKLDKLYLSYHEASEALRCYGVRLRQLQGEADTELGKAVCADEEHVAAIRELTDPHGVTAPLNPEMIGPVPPLSGPRPSAATSDADPQTRLAAARAAVERIRQERETAEAQAVAKLEHASEIGIHNKGLLDRIAGWAGARLADARDFHHKMLRVIGDLADRLADVLTVVAIALVVVALVGIAAGAFVSTGGVAAAFFGSLTAGAWGWSGTALTAAGWATLTSVGAKAQSKFAYNDHDLSWSQLVKDGALAGIGVAGGPVKIAKFVRNHKHFQTAASRMGDLAASGSRAAEFSIKAAKFAGRSAAKYQMLRDMVLGTDKEPTLLGVIHRGLSETQGLWAKHKDDPLAIFAEPIQTGIGDWQRPDGTAVWVRDFTRAVAQV